MRESPMVALRTEYDAIARQLDAAATPTEREAVKRAIIGFFKQVDGLLGDQERLGR